MLYSSNSEEGKQWVESINQAVQQLEANFKTLKKESSARKPVRKHSLLRQKDSLTRIFHQRKNVERRADRSDDHFDVEILKSNQSSSEPDACQTPNRIPSRTIKLPKWPTACPGTPTFPSSIKLLAIKSATSPCQRVKEEVRYASRIIIAFFCHILLPCSRVLFAAIATNVLLSTHPNRLLQHLRSGGERI